MKKYLLAGLAAAFALSACDNNKEIWGNDKPDAKNGVLQLQLKNNAASTTRADNVATDNGTKLGVFAAEELNVQNYTLSLTDSEGAVAKSGLVSDLGGNNGLLTLSNLANGQYSVAAQNYDGSQVNVSTRPWFRGATSLSILPGKTTVAKVTCRLQNIETKVVLSESFKQAFKDDYTVTIDNGESAVQVINKDNIQNKYYFAVPTQKDYMTVSVKASTVATAEKPSNTISRTYTVKKPVDAEGNSYLAAGDALLINLTEDGSMLSYIDFNMTVDFSFAKQEEIFTISTDKITYDESQAGDDEDPSDPSVPSQPTEAITLTGLPAAYTNPGSTGQNVVVKMDVPAGIKSIFITIRTTNASFAEAIKGFGLSETFDLVNPGELYDLLSKPFDQDGLGLRSKESIEGLKTYTFDVTTFMGLLPGFGNNVATFSIEVVDMNGQRKSGDLVVTIQ